MRGGHASRGSPVSLATTIDRNPRLILIVDDDHDLRESMRAILEEQGFATRGASNGKEAIELLRSAGQPRPHVILVDLMMAVMTGFDLIERIRSDRALANIPIVCMTAFRTLAKSDTKVPVLLKPFSIDGVLSAIRQAG